MTVTFLLSFSAQGGGGQPDRKISVFYDFLEQDREHFLKRDVQFEENNLAGGSMVAGADRKVQKTGNSSL